MEYVIDWSEKARIFYKENDTSALVDESFWFKEGITYTDLTTKDFNARVLSKNSLFDMSGPSLIIENQIKRHYLLGLYNSKVAKVIFALLNSSMHIKLNDLIRVPIIQASKELESTIAQIVNDNIKLSKEDWDSFETSFDFKTHPLLIMKKNGCSIKQANVQWANLAEKQFKELKSNEEELNRIFIEIYGLQDELTPEVDDRDITIRKADRERDIKSFISYAVGCMMGRYSLDEEGLVFAGGKFDPERYHKFPVDKDGIIPILDDEYFDDDIVARFVEFVKVTFGEETLGENLDYIAETLGKKPSESSRECIRRYFLKDFYKDHVQTYKKRPIYWLFTSGKEQAFNALIYMHRYDSGTVSRIRTDYLHELQNKLEAEFNRLRDLLVSEESQTEKNRAKKRLQKLEKQLDELKKYEEIIHHIADRQIEIDLDDGVVVNYAKFQDVLAKI